MATETQERYISRKEFTDALNAVPKTDRQKELLKKYVEGKLVLDHRLNQWIDITVPLPEVKELVDEVAKIQNRPKPKPAKGGAVKAYFNQFGLVIERRLSDAEAKACLGDPHGVIEVEWQIKEAARLGAQVTVSNEGAGRTTVITAQIPYSIVAQMKGAA